MESQEGMFDNALETPCVRTWDVLRSIGFEPDPLTLSDPPGALQFDFGNVRVKAIHCLSLRWVEVVHLGGVLRTPRSIAEIDSELPQIVDSREQGIAWLTWCLDSAAGGEFCPSKPVSWLTEGRAHFYRLPWERQRLEYARSQAEFDACPKCEVPRELARSAVRSIRKHIADTDPQAAIEIGFDGEILVMRRLDHVTACPGTGTRWPSRYAVPVQSFREIPSRFMSTRVSFAIFRNELVVDGHRCGAAMVKDDPDGLGPD